MCHSETLVPFEALEHLNLYAIISCGTVHVCVHEGFSWNNNGHGCTIPQ